MYYQHGQNRIFGAKFDPDIYKRGILFIGSPGMMEVYLGIPYPQHASITIFPCLMYYVLDIEFWQFEVRGYHNSTYKDQP